MHKRHMSLTRVPVAGNGHTLPCAHYKLYTCDTNHSSTTTMCQRHNYRNCRRQWEPKALFVQCWLNGAPFSRCARPSWVPSVICIQLLLPEHLWKVCLLKRLNVEGSRRPSATTILSGTWREHSAKHFQFLFGVAHSLSYMLDPCNLGHGLPILLCHSLENTLFESPEDKVTPSNASQHELLYMQYTKYFIATSQHKNEKLFYYKVLLKGSKIQLEYWLVDECEWLELQTIATKLFKMATSRATAEQNFSTMGFIYWNYATASPPRLWKSLCSSRATWQPSTIYYKWLSMSRQIAKMKITKTLFFCVKSVFLD